jgi:hypothetical protein
MANWWDAAPLADAAAKAMAPAASGNWWDAAPLAKDAEKKPDAGSLDAIIRGAGQGLSSGFLDEMAGVRNAASDKIPEFLGPIPARTIAGGARLLANQVTGLDPQATADYESARDTMRAGNKAAEENHPALYTTGQIAGAVAVPVGAGAQAATLPLRMARSAGVGAAMGGLSGAGEGEGAADTAVKAATGAAIGGAAGGVAAPVVEGAVRGARALATPVVNAMRGVRDSEGEAARRYAMALQRDIEADPGAASRLTPEEFAASIQSGGPATAMDLGGETVRALARSAANTSPEGRGRLSRTINDRFEGQAERVTGWLRNTFHYPDAAAQSEALENVGRTVNRANYRRAMAEGDREIFSPELDRLMGSPAMVDAMRKASVSGKDRAITQGLGAMRQGVTVENGVVTFTRGPNGVPTYPNLAFWDATKKELDDAANAAVRSGRNGEASTLRDLARTLRSELDTAVPSYQQARAGAAHFFDAENALEAGQNFVGKNMTSADARRALSQMSPQERQLFQDGFVSRYIETLNQIGDRRSILNKIAESPASREKLNIAIGRERSQELEAGLRVEGIMDLARSAVQGNSTTARQLTELGLAGGVGFGANGFDTGSVQPSALMSAALVYGAAKGRNRINENVSRHVAELLTSTNPQNLARGIRMVARNNTLFNSLRAADSGLARVGGQQAGGVPALQAAGVSRAEDQPNVPRPPGQ